MLHAIQGVEIFSVGTWNGQTFTVADLDKMVESFNKTSGTVKPFLKLGHDNTQKLLQAEGLPAAGWVGNIYRKGDKLVADLVDIPKKIYELIEKKAYRKVSIELFKNVQILADKFDFLISAVALLGAETPGVLNLNDILAQFKITKYDCQYTFTHECEPIVQEKTGGDRMDLEKAQAEIAKLQAQLAEKETATAKFKKDSDDLVAKQAELEKTLKETQEKFAKTQDDLKTAEIKGQVEKLKTEGLITPAMEKGVFQLLNDKTEKFTFGKDEKEVSRFELLQGLFKLAKEGEVNETETTVNGDLPEKLASMDKIHEEVEKYAAENKMKYGAAYEIVAKKYEKQLEAAE